jgi:hypothetical protein
MSSVQYTYRSQVMTGIHGRPRRAAMDEFNSAFKGTQILSSPRTLHKNSMVASFDATIPFVVISTQESGKGDPEESLILPKLASTSNPRVEMKLAVEVLYSPSPPKMATQATIEAYVAVLRVASLRRMRCFCSPPKETRQEMPLIKKIARGRPGYL